MPTAGDGTFAYFCCRAKVWRQAGRDPPVLICPNSLKALQLPCNILFRGLGPVPPKLLHAQKFGSKGAPPPWPSASLHDTRPRRASKTRLRLKQFLACLALFDCLSDCITRGDTSQKQPTDQHRGLEQSPNNFSPLPFICPKLRYPEVRQSLNFHRRNQ